MNQAGKISTRKKRLEIFHFWTGAEQRPIDVLLDKFEKRNPGIKVLRNALEWNVMMAATYDRIINGNPPDVSSNEVGHRLLRFAKTNCLIDLTEIWREQGFFDVFPEWIIKNCSHDDRIYGIPSKCYVFAVWYLVDVFKQHGIKPPVTWEEFLNVCEAFKEAGVYPIVSSGWETQIWFNHLLVNICGAEFYNKLMRGAESWIHPKVIKTYETLLELVKKYFYPYQFGYTFQLAWEMLNKGEAAMQLQGDWVNGMWQRGYGYSPRKEYDFFLLPPINPKMGKPAVMGGNVWMFPRESPRTREAKIFAEYAGSLEAHETLAREGMGILAHKNVPKKAYDAISARLKEESTKGPSVLEMNCMILPNVAAAEERQRMRIILNPSIKKEEIEKLCTETEIVAREEATKKLLFKYGTLIR